MKRLIVLVVLVALAGIAGVVVRSSSGSGIRGMVSHNASAGDVKEEIRQTYELSPGAQVELSSLNGSIKIETSNTKTAEVYIERIGDSKESLARRNVTVEADANSLRIRGERGDGGFFARLFGSKTIENVTLKLPRQISLFAKSVNGSVTVGELDGPVDVRSVNGRVQIAATAGTVDFKSINGNIVVGVKKLDAAGVNLSSVNGNIELRLGADVNADLDAHRMNGRVMSDLPGVTIEERKHGDYSARIGTGGSSISAKAINGNIRLTRGGEAAATAEGKDAKTDVGQ